MFMERKVVKAFAGVVSMSLLILTFAGPVSAQVSDTGQKGDYFEMDIEQLMNVEITTGAGRPLTKAKMPATVTVITADELKLLGLRHLTDVVNYIVPGGIGGLHRGDRSGLYAFRGITSDTNCKFIIMVDGLNITNITAKGANAERWLGLMDELDRIEVIQGVGSSLYGSGATSGVIHFITKTGKAFQGTEVYTGYGSNEKYETTIKYGRKRADDDHDFFYFGWKRSDGSRPRGGEGDFATKSKWVQEHASSDRYWDHYTPSYKFQSTIQRGDFTLRARYVHDQFEEPYRWDVNRNGKDISLEEASDMYILQNYFFVQPEIKHEFNEKSRMKANLAFIMEEQAEIKYHDWFTSGGELIRRKNRRRFSWGEKKLRGQLFHYYDGWANHRFTSGLDLFWMRIGADFRGRNFKYIEGSTTRRESKQRENLYYVAGFLEDIWQLDEKTTFSAGVRIENHELTETSISPRFAVSHDYNQKTTLKFLYNSGFRTPFWVAYTNNESGGRPKPEPEEVRNFEAHIIHKFSPNLTASLIGYYTIYKDLIFYWSSNKYHNFPEVKSSGLELTADYQKDNLKLKFSHSYSRPVHFSGHQLKVSNGQYYHPWNVTYLSYNLRDWAVFPTHMSKLQAIINIIPKKAILGITYYRPWGIRGQKEADSKLKWPRNYLNATLTLNLKENLEFQLSAYNLLREDRPMWGHFTYEGVSRAVNPHTDYFVRLIYKF
jgi:iron complex outermembrane receptor protein